MSFGVSGFTVPKRGNSAPENQDALLPRLFATWKTARSERRIDPPTDQIAIGVADGATEGFLSGVWAHLLLKAVAVLSKTPEAPLEINATIATAFRLWSRFKALRSKGNKLPLTNLPIWLEEQALARGAFSTLCVASFTKDNTWRALSVGDSCMFQVSDESMRLAWPIDSPEEFGNTPYLISSEPEFNEHLGAHVRYHEGEWGYADKFYFATDALACWFLQQEKQGNKPWTQLVCLDAEADPDCFRNFVENKRDAGEMRNDDVTLLRLDLIPTEAELVHVTSSTIRV